MSNKWLLTRRFLALTHSLTKTFPLLLITALLAGLALGVAMVGAQGTQSLYVANGESNEVRRFDGTTGATLGVFGQADGPNGGLNVPLGLVFGPSPSSVATVGGVTAPASKVGLSAPWLGLAALAALVASGVVLVRRRGEPLNR